MKKYLELILLLAVFAAINAVEPVKTDGQKPVEQKETVIKLGHVCYKSIAFQAEQFTKEKKYDEALKLFNDAKTKPEYAAHVANIYSCIASINNETKKYDENIKLWNEGHEKGIVFGIDPKMKEYQPYLKIKGFKEAAKKDMILKTEQAKNPVPAQECGNEKETK
ncbi:MAG: hypothetical protein KKD38_07520 [Candidatus Delongbacteria bacterium]|nr:hypothetical protein [Candidatus Delongbacteria bacterium]MCG2759810.1 hypothetical protein [Candidatus Delongbacteria bacterium]